MRSILQPLDCYAAVRHQERQRPVSRRNVTVVTG